MNDLRWDPSVFINGKTRTSEFWEEHFKNSSRKLLYVMGKGFDVRMNIALKNLLEKCPNINIECWLIEFEEGSGSTSLKYKTFVDENYAELELLLKGKIVHKKKISLWSAKTKGKRKRVGDRQASQLLSDFNQIDTFTDIIVDISALPRGVYFSLVGKFLTFIDNFAKEKTPNFFVVVSENAEIDVKIQETGIDEDVGYLHGFGGTLELTSESEKPVIWFPILGEDKQGHLDKAYSHIRPDEICPVLPFPSKNPRRSDELLKTYYSFLFDTLNIEPQNLMYVPEQNPFEAYVKLIKAIKNYYSSLKLLNGCKAVISTFSSKLLSIGTLLTAYELKNSIDKIGVGVLNVDSQGYQIDSFEELKTLKDESELYIIWLTGEPYNEN